VTTVVLLALASAAAYGVASVLQHQAAGPGPMTHLLRHPRWLLGNLFDAGGFALQLLALHHGSLLLVEPLLVTSLIFAFPVAAVLRRQRMALAELVAAPVVAGGLALFLAVARPGDLPARAPGGGLVLLTVAVAVAVVVLALVARGAPGRRRGILSAAAAGICFGYMAASVALAWHVADHGVVHALTSWEPYGALASGGLGIALAQHAFGGGVLRFSLPTMTVVQPLVAVAIGLLLFGEPIHAAGAAPAFEVLGLAAAAGGVYWLAGPEMSERSELTELSS